MCALGSQLLERGFHDLVPHLVSLGSEMQVVGDVQLSFLVR